MKVGIGLVLILLLFIMSHHFIIAIVTMLKVHGPISQNGDFYSNDAFSPKKSWFQISVKRLNGLDTRRDYICVLQLPIPYCVSLVMVTVERGYFDPLFFYFIFLKLLWRGFFLRLTIY